MRLLILSALLSATSLSSAAAQRPSDPVLEMQNKIVRILVSDSGSVDSVRVHVTSGFVTLDNVARRAAGGARISPRSAPAAREWTDLPLEFPGASRGPAGRPWETSTHNRDGAAARLQAIRATPVVWVYVSETGEVLEIQLFRSGGLSEIDRTALEVARTMQFRPALSEGTPVAVWVEVPLTFDARRQ